MTEVESTDYGNNRQSSTLQYQRDINRKAQADLLLDSMLGESPDSSTDSGKVRGTLTYIPTQTLVTLVNIVDL